MLACALHQLLLMLLRFLTYSLSLSIYSSACNIYSYIVFTHCFSKLKCLHDLRLKRSYWKEFFVVTLINRNVSFSFLQVYTSNRSFSSTPCINDFHTLLFD